MVWDMAMDTDQNLRDLQVLVPIFLLIAGIIMIILCLIAIQFKNDYIMLVFIHVFVGIDYILHVFWYVSIDDACILCNIFIFSVLGDIFWTCDV